MEYLSSLENLWRIGLILITTAGVYIIITQACRISLFPRVLLRGRKHSTARTPPRSISPDNKTGTSPALPPNYDSALPPQRRHALADFSCEAAPWRDVSEEEVRQNLLSMSANYKTSPSDKYTPMGFSVGEIKGLGDFPDYATLSGVPLPSPYLEFEISKALPRPYRPFRWAYHQTMCMC
jgi:hypothetical protein